MPEKKGINVNLSEVVLFVGLGAIVGFAGGLFAIGGALIAIPLLTAAFGFTQHQKIGALVNVRTRGGIGTANDNRPITPVAKLNESEDIGLLWQHSAGHDDVRPSEVGFGQVLSVAVNQPHLPVRWQHGGDSDKAKWRGWITRAH